MLNIKQKVQGKIYEAPFLYRKSDYVRSRVKTDMNTPINIGICN
jgi:hypothetical protein